MKKKVLLSSILTIALCLSIIAGATYALFTSSHEFNIAVTAGTVDITANVAIQNVYSVQPAENGTIVDENGATYEYSYTHTDTFINGGTASVTGAEVTLEKVTPGDKVDLLISGTNNSNVTIQYRYVIECTEGLELMHGLVVYVNGATEGIAAMKSYTSAWTEYKAPVTDAEKAFSLPITIEFPVTAGNEYQNKSTTIKVLVEAVQGNASVSDNTQDEIVCFELAQNDTELDAAIAAGENTIVLGSGNYIIPDSAKGKELTFIGNGETVIATQDDGSYEGCDYSLDGATATFENITINTDSSTYTGYARLNATYNNCTINGTYTLYGDSVFNDCTFNVSGDVYNIWTWGAPNATFNNCTFNSDGKAMLLYGQANTVLTINSCTFNDNGGLTDKKAAIEIGNDYNKSYTLIVNNTVVNGYEINDKGTNTNTTLWGNKNSMGTDKLNVVVDGVDVH